jgi:hypothetical protein
MVIGSCCTSVAMVWYQRAIPTNLPRDGGQLILPRLTASQCGLGQQVAPAGCIYVMHLRQRRSSCNLSNLIHHGNKDKRCCCFFSPEC